MGAEEFSLRMYALAQMVPNYSLPDELFDMYDRLLSPLGYDRVCAALEKIMCERESRDPFPSIKEIKGLIEPTVNQETQAVEAAARIVAGIAKVGPYDVERFKEFVGPLAWKVVQLCGGITVLGELQTKDIPAHRAQWVRIAKAQLERAAAGLTDQAPQIEEKPNVENLKRIGELLRVPKLEGGSK